MSIKDNRGFSLIEVLVGFGLLTILTLAIMSVMVAQNKELKAIDEKSAIQNLRTLVMGTLSVENTCLCAFRNTTFNDNTNTFNAATIPNIIYSGYDNACNPQGGPIVDLTGTSPDTVKPTSITFQNINVVSNARYSSNLVIGLDQGRLVRSRKAIEVPFFFTVDIADPPATRNIIACHLSNTYTGMTDIRLFGCTAPRNGFCSTQTTAGESFDYCALSQFNGNGDDGGATDYCRVVGTGVPGEWQLRNNRGDDPARYCEMSCFKMK